MTFAQAVELAERVITRDGWHLREIICNDPLPGEVTLPGRKTGFTLKAYCYGVTFGFDHVPSDDDLAYLETYGM